MCFWEKRPMFKAQVDWARTTAISKEGAEQKQARRKRQFQKAGMEMPPPREGTHPREPPRATQDRLECGGLSVKEGIKRGIFVGAMEFLMFGQ